MEMICHFDPDRPALSFEEVSGLCTLMHKKYGLYLDGRKFLIDTEVDGAKASVRVLLKNDDETFYYPIEGRLDLDEEEMNAKEACFFLIDYIDLYFEEYFTAEDEDLFIPIDWSGFEYDAVAFELRGQVFNKSLEDLADHLLAGKPEKAL